MGARLCRISHAIAVVELRAAGLLIGFVLVLLLANVATRTAGQPIFWIDELAVYAMIWAAFFGGSAAIASGSHVAVTFLPDMLGPSAKRAFALLVDGTMAATFAVLAVLVWRWFAPVDLLRAESMAAFATSTFNFIYDEPATTMPVRKAYFWLVMPLFCASALFHCAANLAVSAAKVAGVR